MDISKWNNIMSSFQELLGYQKGITEVLVTKRLSKIGQKSIPDINEREEKYLVHILRKRYREINENEQTNDKDTKPSDNTRSDI
tara:strand:- start:805 stop:1056 length:252 start_codon:yes stop_codon:yes gene_type:complete